MPARPSLRPPLAVLRPLVHGSGIQTQFCAGAGPSEGGKICAPCMIWGLRTAKAPLGGKMFARCIPQRRFAGLSGYIARISCQNKLNPNTWRRYIATNRCFSRPTPLFERIRVQSCHGRQHGNASGRYLAMARRRMIATEVHRRPISDCNGLGLSCKDSFIVTLYWGRAEAAKRRCQTG